MKITTSKFNKRNRVFAKNGYIFIIKWHGEENFSKDIEHLLDKWPSLYRKSFAEIANYPYENIANLKKKRETVRKYRCLFLESLCKYGKLPEFESDIKHFLKKHELGNE